jgi:hypothetical protein
MLAIGARNLGSYAIILVELSGRAICEASTVFVCKRALEQAASSGALVAAHSRALGRFLWMVDCTSQSAG